MTVNNTSSNHDGRAETDDAHGRIDWRPWGADAFALAREADKLLLVDIGATWCHWCHVMDRETYEDPKVQALVAEKFVPVRIDRDREPEVDAHFQRTPAVVDTRAGGWPLTLVLAPNGMVLLKATFVPPHAGGQHGAEIGLVGLLIQLDMAWRSRRDELLAAGRQLARQIGQAPDPSRTPGQLTARLVSDVSDGIVLGYDDRHGGFGGAPKFFHCEALRVMLDGAWAGDDNCREVLEHSLEAMAAGGVYDQIGGGFHRYSVDEQWHVPHFEKMAYDNAALLALYADAYALTGNEKFAAVARQSRAWVDDTLGGSAGLGFFASQDADVGLDDDGDYFTWAADEVRAELDDKTSSVALYWYDVDDAGDMHGRPGRNVLHRPKTAEQVAAMLEMNVHELLQCAAEARRKLAAARARRHAPAVDKTVLADRNGMMIDAYLTCWRRLGDETARASALATLDVLLATLRDERGVFAHYREAEGWEGLRNVGMLADQAWMLRALLAAWQASGAEKYIEAARTLADYILRELADSDGAFRSMPARPTDENHDEAETAAAAGGSGPNGGDAAAGSGATIPPARRWEDSPSRSSASVAAQALIDLAYVTGERRYAEAAEEALTSFAGADGRDWALFIAGYAQAVDHQLTGPRSVVVVGPAEDEKAAQLAGVAGRSYVPGCIVVAIDPADPAQAGRLAAMGLAPPPAEADSEPVAYVCRKNACLAPAHTPAELIARLGELKRP